MNEIRHIIWDWNGTLLDDAELCVQCINEILKSRNLKMVNIEFYRDHFSFPVSNYYKKLGLPVSGDEYQEVAKSFIENYKNKSRNLNLQPNCIEVLSHFQKEGIEQSVLSASHHQDLTKYIGQFELNSFMSLISGVDNFHAKGRLDCLRNIFPKSIALRTRFSWLVIPCLMMRLSENFQSMELWLQTVTTQIMLYATVIRLEWRI